MSKVIGGTTVTPMAVPDWEQNDERKADYIKNKPKGLVNKEYVSSTFAGALKGEASGVTAVAIKDVSEVKHNISVELSSDNIPLIPYEINDNGDEYMGGLQYTIHKDGRIELQGVCNNGYDVPMSLETTIKRIVLPKGTYTFDWEESGNDVNNGVYGVYLKDVNGKWFGGTFTIDTETEFDLTIGTITQTGESYNITIKPMLSKGDKLSPPLPENSKVKVFGDNLFDTSIFTKQDCIWKENGVIQSNVNNKTYCELFSRNKELLNMLEELNGVTLTLSVNTIIPSNLRMVLGVMYEGGGSSEYWGGKGSNVLTNVLSLKEGKKIKRFFIRPLFSAGGVTFTDTTTLIKDIKLEVGEKSPYSPYISPQEYEVINGSVTIPSISPSMTLVVENGINVRVKYNKDANIVIASQQAQIDELKAMILNLTTN